MQHGIGFEIMDAAALLLTVSALLAWLNHKVVRLPHTIGMLVIALGASVLTLGIDAVLPFTGIAEAAKSAVISLDFEHALMEGMLSFLLFAGALHVDLGALRERKVPVAIMATAGIMISTSIIGSLIWYASPFLGVEIPFAWALVLGAIISPTDPIAVIAVMKRLSVPRRLYATVEGESLFNDGVGVVVFSILVAFAAGGTGDAPDAQSAASLFLLEAGGGAVLGLAAGYLAFRLMKSIDEHAIEIMITLALVVGAYSLAHSLHVSGPIAVVVAGIMIGNKGTVFAMSEKTRTMLFSFWGMMDELLNSVLFLFIGIEVLAIGFDVDYLPVAALAIAAMIFGRLAAVVIPIKFLSPWQAFDKGTIPVLVWGGIRGGISVALALSLPAGPYKEFIVAITYSVVIFSVVAQGLTVEKVIKTFVRQDDRKSGD